MPLNMRDSLKSNQSLISPKQRWLEAARRRLKLGATPSTESQKGLVSHSLHDPIRSHLIEVSSNPKRLPLACLRRSRMEWALTLLLVTKCRKKANTTSWFPPMLQVALDSDTAHRPPRERGSPEAPSHTKVHEVSA